MLWEGSIDQFLTADAYPREVLGMFSGLDSFLAATLYIVFERRFHNLVRIAATLPDDACCSAMNSSVSSGL